MIYISSGGKGIGGVLTINAENGSIISISQEDVVKSQIANNGKAVFKGVTSGFWNLESHLNDKFYEKQIEININKIVNVDYFEATINVTFPVDCTSVTCSKGDKSYSVPSGSLSSGSYVFNVYEMGEWTLYCTNGTKEKMSTVNITEETAYTVTLSFELVLFDKDAGIDRTDLTGGFAKLNGYVGFDIEVDSTNGYGIVSAKAVAEFANYSKLVITTGTIVAPQGAYMGTTSRADVGDVYPAMTSKVSIGSNGTYTLDISGINSAHIAFCCYGDGSVRRNFQMRVTRIYLE